MLHVTIASERLFQTATTLSVNKEDFCSISISIFFTTTKALKIFLLHSLGSQAGPEAVDAECCDNGIGDDAPVSRNSLSLSLKKDVFFFLTC